MVELCRFKDCQSTHLIKFRVSNVYIKGQPYKDKQLTFCQECGRLQKVVDIPNWDE